MVKQAVAGLPNMAAIKVVGHPVHVAYDALHCAAAAKLTQLAFQHSTRITDRVVYALASSLTG